MQAVVSSPREPKSDDGSCACGRKVAAGLRRVDLVGYMANNVLSVHQFP